MKIDLCYICGHEKELRSWCCLDCASKAVVDGDVFMELPLSHLKNIT